MIWDKNINETFIHLRKNIMESDFILFFKDGYKKFDEKRKSGKLI
jgi:hypothetical protein